MGGQFENYRNAKFFFLATHVNYCKFGNFREGYIFAKLREYKPLWNSKFSLLFSDSLNHTLVLNFERRKYVF